LTVVMNNGGKFLPHSSVPSSTATLIMAISRNHITTCSYDSTSRMESSSKLDPTCLPSGPQYHCVRRRDQRFFPSDT
jgi:hypothetical protein